MRKAEINPGILDEDDNLVITIQRESDRKTLYRGHVASTFMCNTNLKEETELFSLGSLTITNMGMQAYSIAEGLYTYCKGLKEAAQELIIKGKGNQPTEGFLMFTFADSLLQLLKDFNNDVQDDD